MNERRSKNKNTSKAHSLRKAHFEKAQSKDKQKFKSKELVLQYFCSVSKVHIGKGTWWLPTSPGEGVVSGQADPTVGLGSQALPVPIEDCGSESGESGGLVGGGQVHYKT